MEDKKRRVPEEHGRGSETGNFFRVLDTRGGEGVGYFTSLNLTRSKNRKVGVMVGLVCTGVTVAGPRGRGETIDPGTSWYNGLGRTGDVVEGTILGVGQSHLYLLNPLVTVRPATRTSNRNPNFCPSDYWYSRCQSSPIT